MCVLGGEALDVVFNIEIVNLPHARTDGAQSLVNWLTEKRTTEGLLQYIKNVYTYHNPFFYHPIQLNIQLDTYLPTRKTLFLASNVNHTL